ncbi:hypothetical protein TRVA0_032S01596 [Trichomonascus vanleenenianus]|uniref:MAGE domain-containing protein n=1 Tax=Trichomonascus vanleenenianus TaxID=2268995 RepID=UPI003EC9621B
MKRKQAQVVDDEEGEEYTEGVNEEAESSDGVDQEKIQQMARKLAAFAVCHEVGRKLIKRDDISNKIIRPIMQKSGQKILRLVIEEAQTILQERFGMEFRPLPQRVIPEGLVGREAIHRKKKQQHATKKVKQEGSATPKADSDTLAQSYVLSNCMRQEFTKRTPGVQSEEERLNFGLVTLIAFLILSSGNYIKRVRLIKWLADLEVMPWDNDEQTSSAEAEAFINQMRAYRYLEVANEASNEAAVENTSCVYLGPRALVELTPTALVNFANRVYDLQFDESSLEALEKRFEERWQELTTL